MASTPHGSGLAGTTIFRRRQWVRVLAAAIVTLLVGYFVARSVEASIRERLVANLETVRDAEAGALGSWLDEKQRIADALADALVVRTDIPAVLAAARDGPEGLVDDPAQAHLRAHFGPVVRELGFEDFIVLDTSGRVVAATQDRALGLRDFDLATPAFREALSGNATVSLPFRHPYRIERIEAPGIETVGAPLMYAIAPVHGEGGRVIAVLGLSIDPAEDFTRILKIARMGASGETYAFDGDGTMISKTRFPDELVEAGLLDRRGESAAILRVGVRDPGGNLLAGHTLSGSPRALPLTRAAAEAVDGGEGVDVDGYRDYRGVEVVGAWTWLDRYGFGIVTEIDRKEAYAPLWVLWRAFGVLFALACLAVLGALVFARWLDTARRRASTFERAARTLGSYTLRKKIGEGGMGEVWLAQHALLRRPTAVKLLPPEKTSRETAGRFEREVQMTARLSHPNTISIYDYGHTPDAVFYYAMEYLHGMPTGEIVRGTGPMSSARVIHVLRQAAGSLHEAHQHGLVHRDVKPANIMVCDVGGVLDFVKVLDFGLVKDFVSGDREQLSQSGVITGTPMFMAPEMVTGDADVGPLADLYALACVGYFLVSGESVFDCTNAVDHLVAHAKDVPQPPSTKTDVPIDPDLEALLMACLEKDPADRPASMQVLQERLDGLAGGHAWGQPQARSWWQEHAGALETRLDLPDTEHAPLALDIALTDRHP